MELRIIFQWRTMEDFDSTRSFQFKPDFDRWKLGKIVRDLQQAQKGNSYL